MESDLGTVYMGTQQTLARHGKTMCRWILNLISRDITFLGGLHDKGVA